MITRLQRDVCGNCGMSSCYARVVVYSITIEMTVHFFDKAKMAMDKTSGMSALSCNDSPCKISKNQSVPFLPYTVVCMAVAAGLFQTVVTEVVVQHCNDGFRTV